MSPPQAKVLNVPHRVNQANQGSGEIMSTIAMIRQVVGRPQCCTSTRWTCLSVSTCRPWWKGKTRLTVHEATGTRWWTDAMTHNRSEIANYQSVPKPWSAASLTVAGISGALVAGVFAVTVPFVAPAFRRVCVPYVPATNTQINNVLQALNGGKGKLLDIGSGDGRIVIAASKHGLMSHGVELNYWLVLYSRYKAWREGQHKSTKFYKKDLWKTDFSIYDKIVVFGADTLMGGLEKKFDKELNTDCSVLAARFPLPTWKAVRTVGSGIDTVWVYKHPAHIDLNTSVPRAGADLNEIDNEKNRAANPPENDTHR